jgi:acyl dehydratase
MEGRFSSPVYPGETIRTEIWQSGNIVTFRASVPARGVTVINNGRAEILAEITPAKPAQ